MAVRTRFTLHRKERRRIYISFAEEVDADTTLSNPTVRVLSGPSWTGTDKSEHILDGVDLATEQTVPDGESLPGILVWLDASESDPSTELPAGEYSIEAKADASSQEVPVLIAYDDRPPVFRLVG